MYQLNKNSSILKLSVIFSSKTKNSIRSLVDSRNISFTSKLTIRSYYVSCQKRQFVSYFHKIKSNFIKISLIQPDFKSNYNHIEKNSCHRRKFSTLKNRNEIDLLSCLSKYPVMYNRTFTNNKSYFKLNDTQTNNILMKDNRMFSTKSDFKQNDVHINNISKGNYSENADTLSYNDTIKSNLFNFFCTQENSDTIKPLTLIDMTFGDGHHTNYLLENMENVQIICLDRDATSFEKARLLAEKDSRIIPFKGKFSDLPNILSNLSYTFKSIDGIIMDFGVSQSQWNSNRGFNALNSSSDCVLDLRMELNGVQGYEVLGTIDEVNLSKILKIYGEEKYNRKISRAIIETRYTFKKIKTTRDLNELVEAVVGTDLRFDSKSKKSEHVAQKVYNGVRRFVNNEMNEINYAMIIAEKYLKPCGLLMTSTDSIVEDKIVKRHLTGNVVENCASDMSLKFVNHNLTVDSDSISSLTYSPWNILEKSVSRDAELKLRVAMKK